MSKCITEQVTCPRCHYDSPMQVWESINTALDPELAERFLNGELFPCKCEVCGEEMMVPFGTIYHDMEHRFMLFFDPWDDNRKEDEEFDFTMPDGFNLPDYTFRFVYGMNALKEKNRILSAGLNDIVVERMKAFIHLNPENNVRESDKVLFYGIDDSDEAKEKTGWQRGAILFVRLRENAEPKILPFSVNLYYDYKLAVEIDPRMAVKGCACVDKEWMNRQLHKF